MFYHHGAMRREYHDEIGYRTAERIIAVSKLVEQKLRAFRPKYADKMMTLHNLTDVESIREKGAEPIPEVFHREKFNIVSCGRISHEKGMDLAVEACAELVSMGCEDVHWWIVGGGPAEKEVCDKIAELHMENHVTMLGMKENPYPYIRLADLYVQPSRYESYGLTIAEAMVLERKIVSTDTDGAKELICNGENGMLCAKDARSIANSVRKTLKYSMKKKGIQTDIRTKNQIVLEQLKELL